MKIYFAGSIRGGREDKELYLQIIAHLQKHGTVLTEHIGDQKLTAMGEDGKTDDFIYNRDMTWLRSADVIVAEVTLPSLGVGYEIREAEVLEKKVLCLHRPQPGKKLSAMLMGSKSVVIREYNTLEEAHSAISEFLESV